MFSGIRSCIILQLCTIWKTFIWSDNEITEKITQSQSPSFLSLICVYVNKGSPGISHTQDFRLLKLMQMNWFSREVKIVLLISIMIFLNYYNLKKMKKYYPTTKLIFINTNSLNS